jgi:hypothetical protein
MKACQLTRTKFQIPKKTKTFRHFSYIYITKLAYQHCSGFFLSAPPIDAHGLKIQGRGYLMFFPKSLGGVKAFRKNCLGGVGGSPYFGFYCIFINKCFEICLRGVLYLPSPSPHLTPPVCISPLSLFLLTLNPDLKYLINF